MHPWAKRFLAFDTETSGFHHDARVLELSIVGYENGKVASKKSWLFNPPGMDWENPKTQEALAFNKLPLAELKRSRSFEDQLDEVCEGFAWAGVWVAHNINFDLDMIEREHQKCGLALERPSIAACTLALDYVLDKSHNDGWKLAEVAQRRHIQADGPLHRAEADTMLAAKVFLDMLPNLPPSQPDAVRFCSDALRAWKTKPRTYRPRS